MRITHVLRGAEWLSTFPLHVNVVRAFGWDEPIWIHLLVFLKPSGKGKMSKREAVDAIKDGHSIFIKDLEELGFTPEGVLNWMALMGWGVPEDDVMSLDEMVERFSIDSLTPSPAVINFTKLDHFNGTHIRLLPDLELASRIKPFFIKAGYSVKDDLLLKIVPLIRERLVTLDDCVGFAGLFFKEKVEPNLNDLILKGYDANVSGTILNEIYQKLYGLSDFNYQTVEPQLRAYVEQSGFSANQVLGLVRVAVTGQKVSPPLFESIQIIGKEKSLERLEKAIEILERL